MTSTIRRAIVAVYLIGLAGAAADLLLIGHVEEITQQVPLIVMAVAFVAGIWWGITIDLHSRRAFQMTIAVLIFTGVVGLWFHFQGNVEFEREVSPSMSGFPFYWKALQGGSPPSLAPGTLIHLGLIGLISTFKETKR